MSTPSANRLGLGRLLAFQRKGIAASDTRYAILHDMDAMLIRPDLLERRYQLIREREDHFLGIRWYKGNGIMSEDKLAYIVEMAFDSEFLRRECRPLDLFNMIGNGASQPGSQPIHDVELARLRSARGE